MRNRSPALAARRGFTLPELLIASACTALIATAAATMIAAASRAAEQTRNVADVQAAGHYALNRIASTVRSARCVGEVTPISVTLWLSDQNNDDWPNADEMGLLTYDSGAKQLRFIAFGAGGPTGSISQTTLTDAAALAALFAGSTATRVVVWAEGVESLTFAGYPPKTETRIVEVTFTIGTGSEATTFQTAAVPRAPGDYLFNPQAQGTPPPGTDRIVRGTISAWSGLTSVITGGK